MEARNVDDPALGNQHRRRWPDRRLGSGRRGIGRLGGYLTAAILLAGCTRLSKIQFDSFAPTPTFDTLSGFRARPTPWATIDILAGSRHDATFEESRPISQVGVRLGAGKVALIGRLDYILPDDFAGFAALEIEW